jgi:hypothetical protein
MLLVFEAASATIVPFLDTNGDGNPETRAPAMVAFQQPRVPFIKEFQPLDVSCAPGVLSFGGVVLRSTGETDGVIDHQGALIPGRVRVRTATVSQAPSRFLLPPEAGMRSFSMSAPTQSTIQIERSSDEIDNGAFHPVGPPIVVTSSLAHETLPTGTPLIAGDRMRIVTNGVAGNPERVTATSRPLVYSHWPQEAIIQGAPFSLTGANLNQSTGLQWRWIPLAPIGGALQTGIVPVEAAADGTSVQIPALANLPTSGGLLTLQLLAAPPLHAGDTFFLRRP